MLGFKEAGSKEVEGSCPSSTLCPLGQVSPRAIAAETAGSLPRPTLLGTGHATSPGDCRRCFLTLVLSTETPGPSPSPQGSDSTRKQHWAGTHIPWLSGNGAGPQRGGPFP